MRGVRREISTLHAAFRVVVGGLVRPFSGLGPSAALRARGRIVMSSGFASAVKPTPRSRRRWRSADLGPVVRLRQCAVFREVVEDLFDRVRLFHRRDDLHRAAAVLAGLHIDAKHALEALRPATT